MNSKERVISVINGKAADKVPVFPLLMAFSAKCYGVTYRDFASNGHVMAEAQLKARELFPIDAITACSDAFRVSADLGGDIVFSDVKPPCLSRPLIRDEHDFRRLRKPKIDNTRGRMYDRIQAVGEMVRAAGNDCMVLGWVDMPFAEACSACGVTEFMLMLYDEPVFAHEILEFLTGVVIEFAVAQLAAGAPMVGAGDAAASLLSPALYREFALPYEKRVAEAVHLADGLIKLHICGNTTGLIGDMLSVDCDLYNVDHLVDFQCAAQLYGDAEKAFKGNLDPVADMLFSTPELCRQKARERIQAAKGLPYILSPGCEVPADVPDDVFMAFCAASEN